MARRPLTVRELALEAGIHMDEVVVRLLDAGLHMSSDRKRIRSSDAKEARQLLGIVPRPRRMDYTEIASLAHRAVRQQSEVRELLARAGVLKKRRLKRVPVRLLKKAEEILGIREPQAVNTTQTSVPTKALPIHVEPTPKRKKPKQDWPTIGPAQDLNFLTPGDVTEIHWVLVKDFAKSKDPIDPPGVRDQGLLESAVHRPRTALGDEEKYPTVAMAAAALLHAIVLDHPFYNGNKRTALVSMVVFLDKNGWVFKSKEDEAYDFLLRLADHKLVNRKSMLLVGADPEMIESARWLQARIRRISRRERPVPFRQLRTILASYDCLFDYSSGVGNRINITRGDLRTQVAYRNEGTDVERNTIHKIRKDLELDDAHGYDSDIFYNRGPRIPEFITKYRWLLNRLAKV